MISANLAHFAEYIVAQVRKESPEDTANLTDLQLQVAVIDGVRAYADGVLEEAKRIHGLTEAAKTLRQLAELQQ